MTPLVLPDGRVDQLRIDRGLEHNHPVGAPIHHQNGLPQYIQGHRHPEGGLGGAQPAKDIEQVAIALVGENAAPLAVQHRVEPPGPGRYINERGGRDLFRHTVFRRGGHITDGLEKAVAAQHIGAAGVEAPDLVELRYIEEAPLVQIHSGVLRGQEERHPFALLPGGDLRPEALQDGGPHRRCP